MIVVSCLLLGWFAGLGTYWAWVAVEWHVGKRYRSWSK